MEERTGCIQMTWLSVTLPAAIRASAQRGTRREGALCLDRQTGGLREPWFYPLSCVTQREVEVRVRDKQGKDDTDGIIHGHWWHVMSHKTEICATTMSGRRETVDILKWGCLVEVGLRVASHERGEKAWKCFPVSVWVTGKKGEAQRRAVAGHRGLGWMLGPDRATCLWLLLFSCRYDGASEVRRKIS